ncbi:MAG: methyltransferase domain-containing protein [Desulfobulbaceae bacterium]|nr:methyltransferase domain-containing protein [Desulfobulbaceae bacterium]
MPISPEEITRFSKYVLDISGIYLDRSKGYLLETRLKGLMDECRASSYGMLLNQIKADKKLEKKLIDAISTNETFFFRDTVPFDLLRNKIIPDLIDLRRKQRPSGPVPIKIWSAACSTGQEIYSIAITLLEMLPGRGNYEISILGTDISSKAVAQASYGQYNRFEVERGLPPDTRAKYFNQSGASWRIRDEVRSLAKFETMNLLRPLPSAIGPFDIVFCRNVAIYFQSHDKINLFKKIARVIAPGGSLLIGGSENLSGIALDFVSQQYLRGIYYTLKSDAETKKQDAPSDKPPRAKDLKTPARPRRKTVYDGKRPRPAAGTEKKRPEKKTPPPKDVETPVKNQTDDGPPTPIAPPREKIPEPLPSSLTGQLHKTGDRQKTSLLTSLQSKKEQSASLVSEKDKTSGPKGSLLDKISRRKKKR